jgi:hypothetical protein
MAVLAKFYVAEIKQFATAAVEGYAAPKPLGQVTMRAITRGGDDNKQWASATPAATLEMTVNGEGFTWFQERLGKDIALTFDDPA